MVDDDAALLDAHPADAKGGLMSRSGYVDNDDDPLALARWRGMVASAIRGKRGQAMLRDLRNALDAMPKRALITDELVDAQGDVCALGAVGQFRGIEMRGFDPDEPDGIAEVLNVAPCLVQEIEFMNDEVFDWATPPRRWEKMRDWVDRQIRETPTPKEGE